MRRLPRGESEAVEGELNVVPYLDILMNLILFMLLSMTGLATLGAAPARAASGGAGGPALGLTLTVKASEYVLEGAGLERRVLARDEQLLTAALLEVKHLYPSERSVLIRPEGSIEYAELVATLDATREASDRAVLFPDVVLAFYSPLRDIQIQSPLVGNTPMSRKGK